METMKFYLRNSKHVPVFYQRERILLSDVNQTQKDKMHVRSCMHILTFNVYVSM